MPSRILLWLLVINLGTTFGAGVYEARISVASWLTTAADGSTHWRADAAREDDTGRRFWAFVTTGPLTLITAANVFAARRAIGRRRRAWLSACVAALVDRALTFGYFIPTMVWLMQQPDSPASVATASTWASLNYVRLAVVFVAWIYSLQALDSQ